MALSGSKVKEFQDALLDAFDGPSLEQMVRIGLDVHLEVIAGGANLHETVYNLIKWADKNGRITDLVKAAVDRNPGNPKLKYFAESYIASGREQHPQVQDSSHASPRKAWATHDVQRPSVDFAEQHPQVQDSSHTSPDKAWATTAPTIWKYIVGLAEIVGAIGIIAALPGLLEWLHGVWGPISCTPTIWLWVIVSAFFCVLLVLWMYWKRPVWAHGKATIIPTVSLAIIVVFGVGQSIRNLPRLEILPSDTFNIVITNFGEGGHLVTEEGKQQIKGNYICNSARGQEFSEQLRLSLYQMFGTDPPTDSRVQVVSLDRYVHDYKEARKILQEMNATILVWGWFLSEDGHSFVPQFVVNDPSEALEPAHLMNGLASAPNRAEQVAATTTRVRVLSDFIFGIFSMYEENQVIASQHFQRALDLVLREQEVENLLPLLYYYSGRMDSSLGNATEAEAKFDAGLALNGEYAILYLNKGNIFYDQARQNAEDPPLAFSLLEKATAMYERALTSLEKENTQFVDGKAHANLGNVAFTYGQIREYQEIHSEAESARDPVEDFKSAISEYDTALALFEDARAPTCVTGTVSVSKALAYEELQDLDKAEALYANVLADNGSCDNLITIAEERLAVLADTH